MSGNNSAGVGVGGCYFLVVPFLCMPMGLTGPELGDFLWLPPGLSLDDEAGASSDVSYDSESIGSHISFTGQFPRQQ